MYLMETDINRYQIRITFVNVGNISIVKSSAPTDLCVCARKSAPNTIKMLNSFYSQITSQTDWFFVSPTLIWERYIHFVCIIPIWTINQFCKYCRSMGFIAETQTYHQWKRFNLEDLAFFKRKMLKQQQQQKKGMYYLTHHPKNTCDDIQNAPSEKFLDNLDQRFSHR